MGEHLHVGHLLVTRLNRSGLIMLHGVPFLLLLLVVLGPGSKHSPVGEEADGEVDEPLRGKRLGFVDVVDGGQVGLDVGEVVVGPRPTSYAAPFRPRSFGSAYRRIDFCTASNCFSVNPLTFESAVRASFPRVSSMR